jgi:tetratricopeptide (TPR) repeat protein
VIEAAGKVREASGGSVAAATAALLQGDAHLSLGEWDRAIAAYQGYLAGAPADDSLRFAALDGMARAQDGKGELEAALKTYASASEIGALKDRAELGRARLLAKAGRKDEARKALESIPPTSPLRAEVQERLARLGGD